jgi:hypothetical protein
VRDTRVGFGTKGLGSEHYRRWQHHQVGPSALLVIGTCCCHHVVVVGTCIRFLALQQETALLQAYVSCRLERDLVPVVNQASGMAATPREAAFLETAPLEWKHALASCRLLADGTQPRQAVTIAVV